MCPGFISRRSEEWLAAQSLKALCERLIRAGSEIQRAVVGSLVFHPQYDAINFTWTPDTVEVERHPIRRTDILQCPTPFFHLHSTGNTELRQRLDETNKPPLLLFRTSAESRFHGLHRLLRVFRHLGRSGALAGSPMWNHDARRIPAHSRRSGLADSPKMRSTCCAPWPPLSPLQSKARLCWKWRRPSDHVSRHRFRPKRHARAGTTGAGAGRSCHCLA